MPRAVIADSRPEWAKPETASVTDSAATRALRWAAWATGADKPESQITALLAPLETGAVGGLVGRIRSAIRAYHGSPHNFDRFDVSKIGTGEGAQTYGHGLYFSEAEPVAQSYRDKLAGKPPVIVGGQEIPTNVPGRFSAAKPWDVSDDPQQMVATRIATKVGQQRAIGRPLPVKTALDHIEAELEQGMYRAVEQRDERLYNILSDQRLALQRMRDAGIDVPTTGHMYEVNLHTDPARLLDWDRPVAEQPHVLDVLREHGYSGEGLSGRDAYKLLQEQFNPLRPTAGLPYWETEGEAAARASQHLHEGGVPGIKYLDQLSRGRPDPALLQKQLDDAQAHLRFLRSRGITDPMLVGSWERHEQQAADRLKELQTTPDTRNIVLFHDSPIEILRKYGLVPAAPAAAAQLANTSPPPATPPLPASPPRALPAPAPVTAGPAGLLEPGNIDLSNRPHVRNADGTVSTVRSISANFNGREVLIPTVVGNRVVSNQEAIDAYKRTGQHLGIFDTPDHADTFAQTLHESEAAKLSDAEKLMPQAQPDETMRAAGGPARKPIIRIIDGVPHEYDATQADGPTGGWIPQGAGPAPAAPAGRGPAAGRGSEYRGGPWSPADAAQRLELLKQFLTLAGATTASALAPEVALPAAAARVAPVVAPWLARALPALASSTVGGAVGRTAASVPTAIWDTLTGQPSSTSLLDEAKTGGKEGALMEGASLAAGPALRLAAGGARWVGKLGGDVMPRWVGKLGIPHAEDWWRPATAVLRGLAGRTAGLPAVADVAASTIPPAASWAAPRLEAAGEFLGSRTLGERASGALEWLQSKLPGILKADAPGAAAATAAEAAESPAVAASRARFQARQAAPTREAAEAAAARTRVIEPRQMEPWEVGQEWVEGSPTPKNPPAAAAAPPPAAPAPAAPRPVGRSQTQWQQFQQPPRQTPAGNIPIGTPAADPGIELNLSGPNIEPPTPMDVLQQQAGAPAAPPPPVLDPAAQAIRDQTATATERLQQQAGGLRREPLTAQQLEDAHAKMTAANAAAREAEAAAAGPLEGDPNTRTLPTGDVIPWDDATAAADAADFDPVAAFNQRFGTGEAQARKATAQERRMSAMTNKELQPNLLPESSGLRDAGDLSFDPATGEIGKWADVPETATDRLVRMIRKK